MARVLSRAGFNEGVVLHAGRAAAAALGAVFADRGWAITSHRCADLCAMLEAHEVTPPQDVRDAAAALDAAALRLDPERARRSPAEACTDDVAGEALDAVKRIRSFVNTVLTRR
jgi:HEPN domain-containing protein